MQRTETHFSYFKEKGASPSAIWELSLENSGRVGGRLLGLATLLTSVSLCPTLSIQGFLSLIFLFTHSFCFLICSICIPIIAGHSLLSQPVHLCPFLLQFSLSVSKLISSHKRNNHHKEPFWDKPQGYKCLNHLPIVCLGWEAHPAPGSWG